MTLGVRAGRLISLGPVWSEADGHLAFDAASGDFWVLSSVSRRMVEWLVQEGPLESDVLRLRFGALPSGFLHDQEWMSTVAGLIAAGLLQELGASKSPAP